jgi:hypothetical protein
MRVWTDDGIPKHDFEREYEQARAALAQAQAELAVRTVYGKESDI